MARISIYKQWEKDGILQDKLIMAEAMSRDGLVQDQIAKNLGISIDSLIKYKKEYPEFNDSLKKGKEVVDIEVENSLLKRAMGYKYEEVTKESYFDKQDEEYKLKVTKVVTKEVQPDVTAQIYWLKNRKPNQWRDRIIDEENNEQINNAKDILFKIRKMADDGTTN